MSDRVVQLYNDCDGGAAKSIHSYQPVWMAHWMRTSYNAAPQMHNYLSHPFGNKEDDHGTKQLHLLRGVEIASDSSRSVKGFREVGSRTFGIMGESLTMSSKNLGNERLGFQPFPIFDLGQKSGNSSVSKKDQDTSHRQALRPVIDQNFEHSASALCTNGNHFPPVLAVAGSETSPRECRFQPEGISQNPAEQVNSHILFGDSRIALSRPLQEDFTSSASHIMPGRVNHGGHRFDNRRAAVPSFMCRKAEINKISSILAPKEDLSNTNLKHCNGHNHSAFLVCERKRGNCSASEKSVAPYLRQNNPSLYLNDPSTSDKCSPVFGEEQYQRMPNVSGIGLFPSQISLPEMTQSEKLYHGHCLLQSMPHSVHDLETMRICTSVDPVEGLAGAPPRFSQTTRSLLITKKTDVNLCKENQMFSESRVSSQVKGNTFSELHSLSPLFGRAQRGVKLQPLGSSTDSERKENEEDAKASEGVPQNESSAETDTMDMDSFKEKNHIFGVKALPSNKDIMMYPSLPSQATVVSAGEAGFRRPVIDLPDINLELVAPPAAASSVDIGEPSTSRTQSLDMELLLLHAEKPSNSKSNHCSNGPLGPEPSSRWVKRLKLNVAGSCALGTKSSNLGEASSPEKVSKFVSKITKGSITSSELTLGNRHGKELMVPDQTTALLRTVESSSVDTVKKAEDITLSHSWIQRWRHNRAATPQKKPEAVVVCDPQSSKVALDDIQKKQFPSVAAMALMGKAMNGFPPCEFQKRGSSVVWNTKGS